MSDLNAPQKLNALPPVATPEGEPIKRDRLKSPSDLISQYETLYIADLESAKQRTLAQEQRDGVPPYDPTRERAAGLAGRANVNWGLLDSVAVEAEAPYIDILEGIDEFCTMPTNFGSNQQQRMEWERIISEEFTLMLKSWPRFFPLWQQNVRIFVSEGLSFAFFDDDEDWRWNIKGQQEIKFPRRTEADINTLDLIAARIEIPPHKLFAYCQDKEVAVKEGWNPDAVWQAILRLAGQQMPRGNDLQEWEKAWKNNDLILGSSNLTVPCIAGWVRELDGSVSQYLAAADSVTQNDTFLFKRVGKYRRLSNMIIAYSYGVGTNGCFHSVRGIHQKAFASCSGINRALNRMLDMSIHGSTPWITTNEEDTLTELPLVPMGPYGVLKPGAAFVENKVPPFEQTLIPALNFLQQVFQTRTSQFTSASGGNQDRTERTAYEKRMQYEREAKLSTSGMNLFKASWTAHLKEIARRVCRKGYASDEPGGEEVTEFRARCLDRGVPAEAIDEVDIQRIEANLGLGKGSATERRIVVDALNQMLYYRLDPQGRAYLDNMTASAYAGTRIANLLSPVQQGLRPPSDLEFANLENFNVANGGTVPVLPNQDHAVHISSHIEEMGRINEGITHMQVPLEQGIPKLMALQQHNNDHMQYMDQQDPQAATFRDALNEFNQVIDNGNKQLFAQQEKMRREAEHNGMVAGQDGQPQPQGDGGTDANAATLVQAAQAQQKVADMQMLTNQKLHQNDIAFRQKMAIEDAKAAAEIRRGK